MNDRVINALRKEAKLKWTSRIIKKLGLNRARRSGLGFSNLIRSPHMANYRFDMDGSVAKVTDPKAVRRAAIAEAKKAAKKAGTRYTEPVMPNVLDSLRAESQVRAYDVQRKLSQMLQPERYTELVDAFGTRPAGGRTISDIFKDTNSTIYTGKQPWLHRDWASNIFGGRYTGMGDPMDRNSDVFYSVVDALKARKSRAALEDFVKTLHSDIRK